MSVYEREEDREEENQSGSAPGSEQALLALKMNDDEQRGHASNEAALSSCQKGQGCGCSLEPANGRQAG